MAAPIRTCLSLRSAAVRGVFTSHTHRHTHALSKRCNAGFLDILQQSTSTTVPIYQRNLSSPWIQTRGFHSSLPYLSAEEATEPEEEYHSIIKDTERSKGPADKHEFQAETRKLLDIVARSLYSEKEVFIRELISNASDALEKFRYLRMTENNVLEQDTPLEIHIATDETKKTFTVQDTGLGMSKEEMVENLGTIARSGSKAFLDTVEGNQDVNSNIIGQFGVGFYSSFMVGNKVDVFSQSYKPGSVPHEWTSDGTGQYELSEAEGVQRGTKIVVHLKGECAEFSKEDVIKEVIQKYSNFVGVPIYLNGKLVNVVQPLWTMEPREVTEEMHEEFYRYIANAYDKPRYHIHYKTDAPLSIKALFYIPEYKPNMFDMSRETDVNLQLYSRKVLIMATASTILPKWLRFVKGVVDSEDIPLNLSRELLQDSALIRKLNQVLTNRILKFLHDQAKKDTETYLKFYEDYGIFFREGIVTSPDQDTRESIAKLLRFESSKLQEGETTSLEDYTSRMKAGSREIYYLATPSRELAETSPYLEALREKDVEVLFLYEAYDELTLMNLAQFDKKNLKSVESELTDNKDETGKVDEKDPNSLPQEEAEVLMNWLKTTLLNKVNKVKVTNKLQSHPCVVSVQEMGSARHFLKTTFADKSQDERFRLLQPTLEINPRVTMKNPEVLADMRATEETMMICSNSLDPNETPYDTASHCDPCCLKFRNSSHPLIKKLSILQAQDPYLAKLVAEQLYDNAMVTAGLLDDPRSMVTRLNQLLEKALEKV